MKKKILDSYSYEKENKHFIFLSSRTLNTFDCIYMYM